MANTIDFNVSTNAVNVLNQTGAAAENTAKGFTTAKAELRALNQQLLQMDSSSEEFKKASARAAELKDNISDLSAEISANAGNAFEGLSNNVGLFGSRLMSLDLKGAGQALKGMGSAVSKIDFKTVKEEVGGLVSGFSSLAKAIIANPIFLLAGALVGIIAYWKELNGLINASDVSKLEKQKQILQDEARILETQLATEKAKGISIENQYNKETAILKKKIDIAIQEEKLAILKGDTEARTEAIKVKEQAIYDLKLLQAQLEGKINAGVEEAKRTTDAAYGLQQKKNEAAKAELDAIESIKTLSRQDAETIKNKMLDINAMNAMLSRQSFTQQEIIDAKNQGLITERDVTTWIDDSYKSREAIEGKLKSGIQNRINIGNTEVEQLKQVMFSRTSELGLLVKSAKAKMDAVKSEEELAKLEAEKRAKEEADAEAKRKREERLRQIEEAKKKLAQDIADIEKDIAQFKRRGMSDIESEIYQAEEKYKIQRETYIRAKKSKKELEELEELHNIHIVEILQKGDAEQAKIDEEANALKLKQQQEADEKLLEEKQKAAEKEKERQKQQIEWEIESQTQLAEARWNIANSSISLLGTLFAKNKKAADVAFALEKGLAIAKVVVSNRAANAEILSKQLAFYSSSGPLALPLAAASAAPMFAANNLNAAASIAAIVASGVSKFMGGGGTSLSSPSIGGGGGMAAPSPANFAFVGNQPNQQQPPLQAYVVGTQVSSNLEAQQLIQNQSRLGG